MKKNIVNEMRKLYGSLFSNRCMWSGFISLLVIFGVYVLAGINYVTLDDYMQNMYVNGRYYEFSYLMPYSFWGISYPLAYIYKAMPEIPWWPSYLLLNLWIAFSVYYYLLIRENTSHKLVIGGLIVFFEILGTLYFTYTTIAFFVTAAGVLYISKYVLKRERIGRCAFFISTILIFCGFNLRPEPALATLFFLFPFLIFGIFVLKSWRILFVLIQITGIVGISYLGALYLYSSTDGWENLPVWLENGRMVVDSAPLRYENLQSIIPKWSRNDIDLLYQWFLADKGVFDLDSFNQAATAVDRYNVYNLFKANGSQKTIILYFVIGGGFLLHLILRKKMDIHIGWLSSAVYLEYIGFCFIMLLRDRAVPRVIMPMGVIMILSLLMMYESQKSRIELLLNKKIKIGLLCLLVGFLAASIYGLNRSYVYSGHALLTSNVYIEQQKYIHSHSNELILLMGHPGYGNSIWEINKLQYPPNVLQLNASSIRFTGPWTHHLKRLGIDENYVMGTLLVRENAVFLGTEKQSKMIQTYLSEHSNCPVGIVKLDTVGNTDRSVYRYKIIR